MGVTGIPCSSPSPELPLKTDVCVKKAPHLPNHQPRASFLVSSGLRITRAFVQCAVCPVVFLFSLKTCYLISLEQKTRQQALQDRRKEENSEAMCTLLSWLHFSTPKKKKNWKKHGSVLQTSLERHLNLIKSTSALFAHTLQCGTQITKLEKNPLTEESS